MEIFAIGNFIPCQVDHFYISCHESMIFAHTSKHLSTHNTSVASTQYFDDFVTFHWDQKLSSFDCLLSAYAYESLAPNYEFGEQINEFEMRNSWNPLKHCSVIQSGKCGQSWTV